MSPKLSRKYYEERAKVASAKEQAVFEVLSSPFCN